MFENEIDNFDENEFSDFFGRRRNRRRPNKSQRRRKLKRAMNFLPPVALYKLGRKAITGRRFNDFDGEDVSMY